MSLFGFGKKKESEALNNQKSNEKITANISNVCILGSGCAKCNELEKNTVEALNSLGIKANIEHETDFAKIASYGVMTTPALAINNKVVSSGKVLKAKEVADIIKKLN